jgi:hypothetical protein
LEGFTNPSNQGQLSVFDLEQQRWFETGTARVGAARGFYDYSPGSVPDQTADEAFAELEGRFPTVRRQLISTGFACWAPHLDFLLAYAQMLRARSQLFREQALVQARQATILKVEAVLRREPIATKPETFETGAKVKPYVARNRADHESLLRNMTITQMRMEIAKGSGLFSDLHWCLRLTADSTGPVVTAEDAVVATGAAPTLDVALRDRETLIFFPLCWQACLVGSPAKFDTDVEAFHQGDLRGLQTLYLKSDCRFLFSPVRLSHRPP